MKVTTHLRLMCQGKNGTALFDTVEQFSPISMEDALHTFAAMLTSGLWSTIRLDFAFSTEPNKWHVVALYQDTTFVPNRQDMIS